LALIIAACSTGAACENDVAVHLLAKASPSTTAGDTSTGGTEPSGGAPDAPGGLGGDPPVCVSGDPCSGLARTLYFSGAYDRIEIASSPLLDVPQDFAIEAWVLPKSYDAGHGLFNRWATGVGDIQLTFGTPEPVSQLELPSLDLVPSHVLASWAFVRTAYWLSAVAPALPELERWHHIAVSYGAGSFRLYVDGVVQSSLAATEPVANAPNTLFIGATARHERAFDESQGSLYWPPIDGFIAEVRISSVNRYPVDFKPEPRLSTDSSTIALWHIDEGQGTTVADSGANQQSGTIFGARWALAPLRPAIF
jgi:hypothetical protein